MTYGNVKKSHLKLILECNINERLEGNINDDNNQLDTLGIESLNFMTFKIVLIP